MTTPDYAEFAAVAAAANARGIMVSAAGIKEIDRLLADHFAGVGKMVATSPAPSDTLEESERLHYERRIVAAECGTQRILNALYGYLKWSERQARFNTDTLDPKAAEILANLAERVRGFDVIAFNEKEVGVATDLWENADLVEARADVALWKREAADRSEGMVQLNLDRAAMGVAILQLRECVESLIAMRPSNWTDDPEDAAVWSAAEAVLRETSRL